MASKPKLNRHLHSVYAIFLISIFLVIIIISHKAFVSITAHATFVTINVGSGDYVVPAGELRSGLYIRLFDPEGSVIMEPGSMLINSKVSCEVTNHRTHGIIIAGDYVTLESVQLGGSNCGGNGVHAVGVSDFHYWQGKITQPRGHGIYLEKVNNSELFGVWVVHAKRDGIFLNASNQNQIVATLVYVSLTNRGLVLDADSHQNQVVRSRARYNKGVIQSDAIDNLFYHSVCESRVGYVGCLTADDNEPRNWGDPADFTPRWRTACYPASFQGSKCDYLTPQLALAYSSFWDRVVTDTNSQAGWGNVTISIPGVLLLGNELTMKGRYGYVNYIDSLNVTASGVHVQNFVVRSIPIIQSDTVLSAVEVTS